MPVRGGLIGVRVRRCRGATLTVHPAGVTIQVVLLFPDGQAVLDLIDDVTASAECFVAVRGADTHPDGELAHCERADAMNAGRVRHTETRARLGEDALPFADAERLEGFILECAHALTFVAVAYPTFEGGVAAAGGVSKRDSQLLGGDGGTCELE